ncbi:MAG: P-II family nitrogen regulator [Rhodospirillales bacterium]|jgi:nitrogen regulatory protein PII|nr:P-II family nitrogen regulator [Rhodospirillales bacterium]MBT4040597.1 P-II family nitrogen regulator [Rhodospirillales bacterium]MBT4626507.1 P-II family nitrogen regulator [Rhodospirillales bacterium]MBT5352798.1 P-II family nitrogen regulator [Rhodospirillales bacterium]MBT5520845.1 P-II family nitrogen regulator [Rhodospirillales bacterium]
MNLKLITALVADEKTDAVMAAAREAGATGATVITSVRGEGLKPEKSFLGLELTAQRDMLLFIVAAPLARSILETIADAGKFDEEPGSGMAFQLEIEDAVGMKTQQETIIQEIEESL